MSSGLLTCITCSVAFKASFFICVYALIASMASTLSWQISNAEFSSRHNEASNITCSLLASEALLIFVSTLEIKLNQAIRNKAAMKPITNIF